MNVNPAFRAVSALKRRAEAMSRSRSSTGGSSAPNRTVKETAITDQATVHLAKMTNLTDLHIQGTEITAAGIGNLHSLKSLEMLVTGESREPIALDALAAISRAIPDAEIIDKGRAVFIAGESDI